jgi:hypothetical protein
MRLCPMPLYADLALTAEDGRHLSMHFDSSLAVDASGRRG